MQRNGFRLGIAGRLAARQECGKIAVMLGEGAMLGPYRIEAPLGAGGMGEVYRARDTRLNRTVAIKLLPVHRLADPESKRRFLQEARAASALNHPNIVALYDIASDQGMDFLVLEYVPGKTLDRLIPPRGLEPAEAVAYARQIAGALAAAHAAGIVHRDIKPANVIVTPESQVKILDFGLAKLAEPRSAEGETQTIEAFTQTGAVMGTLRYMAPEQVRGEPVDRAPICFPWDACSTRCWSGRRRLRGRPPPNA